MAPDRKSRDGGSDSGKAGSPTSSGSEPTHPPILPDEDRGTGPEPGRDDSGTGPTAGHVLPDEELTGRSHPYGLPVDVLLGDEPQAVGEGAEEVLEAEAEPDYKDQLLRAMAETDNVRKRARRDVDAANARGIARLAKELLPSLDNLDRALAAAEAEEADAEHHLTRGIRLVQQELLGAFERVGIEPFSPVGQPFDPHSHDAVAQHPVEGVEPGTVAEVYQSGYRYKDEILRAAKVVVAA
ncbi:MAG TPA: nucleotide exchange factor GrpE [Baekduia sp.]|nr:nucleotide exchange factor GrpE [Baekduia sp.]